MYKGSSVTANQSII